MKNPKSIILTGPTAAGKSSVSLEFAQAFAAQNPHQIEIINADSVCFYQEFNIGAAKPTRAELAITPHHLVDVVYPDQVYHAGQFIRDFDQVLQQIHARGNRALIVGGSGFYLKALRLGLWDAPATSPEFRSTLETISTDDLFTQLKTQDPVHAEKVGTQDRYRLIRALEILALSGKKPSELEAAMSSEPNPDFELWIVDREKEELSSRIRERIQGMLKEGVIEETKTLLEKYPESKTLRAVGYAEIVNYLSGVKPAGRKMKEGLAGLVDEIDLSHRQLAKSQRTWFKNLKPDQSFVLDQDRPSLIEKLMKFYQ